jgi:hypothetical protein
MVIKTFKLAATYDLFLKFFHCHPYLGLQLEASYCTFIRMQERWYAHADKVEPIVLDSALEYLLKATKNSIASTYGAGSPIPHYRNDRRGFMSLN